MLLDAATVPQTAVCGPRVSLCERIPPLSLYDAKSIISGKVEQVRKGQILSALANGIPGPSTCTVYSHFFRIYRLNAANCKAPISCSNWDCVYIYRAKHMHTRTHRRTAVLLDEYFSNGRPPDKLKLSSFTRFKLEV